jgi:hypothetical protein
MFSELTTVRKPHQRQSKTVSTKQIPEAQDFISARQVR